MTDLKGPAPNPCESCPYRRDVPSGVWSEEEYRKLPGYDGEMHSQHMQMFQCHQNSADSDKVRLCAGWVACHGAENLLALRIGVATGQIDFAEVAGYTTHVPLFESGEEACEHGVEDIDWPSPEAQALVEKISNARPDVRFA